MARPGSLLWFARHELRLAWRDFLAMMTGGKTTRTVWLALGAAVFAVLAHWVAGLLLGPTLAQGLVPDRPTLMLVTGAGLLFFSVMLSQAVESVTRAYYTRADLDLILASPASARKLLAVRAGAIAISTMALSCLLAAPVINVLAFQGGLHWLSAYLVLVALGAFSAGLAMLVTLGLFATLGPKRTRLVAQILAAIIGAGFIIGIQAGAILSYGNLSRLALFQSETLLALAPDPDSPLFWPARAAMGELGPLLAVALVGLGSLAVSIGIAGQSFARHATDAAGLTERSGTRTTDRAFRTASPAQALRRKEWLLLRRDPWLLSQTLMQILYLLPPALLLWLNYGNAAGVFVVIVPVLVMASGQLAGGLAWLAISGEDAHELIATAPISQAMVLRAKIEAVAGAIALVLMPLLLLLALAAPMIAVVTAVFAAIATASSTAIQLWFRAQARRNLFRRRQVSSRIATLAEAFASIMWAGAAALVAAGSPLFFMPAVVALGVLATARAMAPKRG